MKILYFDLDSLRPDHLGCYGYHRDTSPNIDRIAAQGVRFTQCYASDVPCAPSRTALVSGRFGIHSGLVGHGGTAGDVRLEGERRGFRSRLSRESLPGYLAGLGYHTASISPFAERHGAYSFYAGFREMHNTGKAGMESAEEVTPHALRWITANAGAENWFLHLNYWDPHMLCRVPTEFGNPFVGAPLPAWYGAAMLQRQVETPGLQMPRQTQESYRRYAQGTRQNIADLDLPPYPRNPTQIASLDDVRMIVDGYDCAVRYLDEHVGRVLGAFAHAGVLDDLTIIISADHGENLGELGIYGNHMTADATTCRVPLIVRLPGGAIGRVDHGLRYHLDLAPTLAELHGQEPLAVWDGRSYAGSLRGDTPVGWGELILSTCAGTCQRSVRFDQWLYTRTYHDGYNLFPQEMLFDLTVDPHEEHDKAAERPAICREAAYHLNDWHDRMMLTMPPGTIDDPLWTVIGEGGPSHVRGRLPAYLALLRQTGYPGAALELARRHPADVP